MIAYRAQLFSLVAVRVDSTSEHERTVLWSCALYTATMGQAH